MDTDKLRKVLAQRLKERHFSQRSASLEAGLHPNTLNNIMQLRRVPDPETLRKLADLLELDEDDLMEMAGHRTPRLENDEVPPKLRTWFHRLNESNLTISARAQDLMAYILRQEFEAQQQPTDISTRRPQVLAAAGDADDINTPNNQRLLEQLAADSN